MCGASPRFVELGKRGVITTRVTTLYPTLLLCQKAFTGFTFQVVQDAATASIPECTENKQLRHLSHPLGGLPFDRTISWPFAGAQSLATAYGKSLVAFQEQ